MANNPKVLFYVAEVSRFNGGQRSLLQLASHLKNVGVESEVLFPSQGICEKAYREAGVKTKIIQAPDILLNEGSDQMGKGLSYKLTYFISGVIPYSRSVGKYFTENGFNILHCNTTKGLIHLTFLARQKKVKTVWHVRGELKVFSSKILSLAGKLSNSIILVADAMKKSVPQEYHNLCKTVYNAISMTSFKNPGEVEESELKQLKESKFIISTFAAIRPFKGQHHILSAAKILQEKYKEKAPLFLLIGQYFDENYLSWMKDRIEKDGIKNVKFLGWKDNPFAYYDFTDAILLSTVDYEELEINGKKEIASCSEGLPRTVVEGMFLKKLVVATKVAGTAEQIENEVSGLIIPPSDATAMASAVEKLMHMSETEKQKMRTKAGERASQLFDTDIMLNKMADIYKQLVV